MLKAVVDRFEGSFAVLVFEDGQTLNISKTKLSCDIHEGSIIWLSILNDEKETKTQKQLAKEILNEILKPNNQR